jgi:dihydrofolate synthase / folylpolyglutamate synthase
VDGANVDSTTVAVTEAQKYGALLAQVEEQITGRWGEGRMNPTKERIAALVGLLGDPQQAYRSIHITGTNGKTSTARMIDELIRAFGLRTGRYTSPHLTQLTERIVLDGEPVPPRTLVEAYAELAPFIELVDAQFDIKLSFFEIMTALAYAIFADAPVDVAIVEVGLGGEWDATNVIDAEIAVVTPIGLDHTELLGNDVATIAREKAGIIKAGATAVLAAQDRSAAEELVRRAVEVDATVAREGLEFGVLDRQIAVGGQVVKLQGLGGVYEDIFLPLHGAHQGQNASLALAAVEIFFGSSAENGPLDIDRVREAFAAVESPGRLEAVRADPTVLLDAAHNPHGMTATVAAIGEAFDFRTLIGVVSVLSGKDARGLLEPLEPVLAEIVITQNSSPRAMDVDELASYAVELFGSGRVLVEPRLDEAIRVAIDLADTNEFDLPGVGGVLVTGSVVTVGEARTILAGADE